jgi:peptidoglycan hydrolase CwlO-like protein
VNSAGLVALLAGITALVTATVSGLTGWLRQHHQGKAEDKTSALSEIDIAWRISSEAIARLDRDVEMLNEKVRDTEARISRQAAQIRQLERENAGLRLENANLRVQVARLERPEGA